MNTELHFSTGDDEIETPDAFFAELHKKWNFAVDVAAIRKNAKLPCYYGPDHVDPLLRDCLRFNWFAGGPCWMNPPYSDPELPCKKNCKKKRCPKRGYHLTEYRPGCVDFVRKAAAQRQVFGITTVALMAARTDNEWFHDFIWDRERHRPRLGVDVDFLRGRLKFKGTENSAPFPSMLVTFDGTTTDGL